MYLFSAAKRQRLCSPSIRHVGRFWTEDYHRSRTEA